MRNTGCYRMDTTRLPMRGRGAIALRCASTALVLGIALHLWPAPAAAHEQFSIQAHAQEGAVALHVQARIRARHTVIWSTLTDYDRLPQFVPCMSYSRVLERRGGTAVVEQKGAASLLLFSFPIEVTVESVESPPHSIRVRVLKGNLRQLDGGYSLKPVAGGTDEYELSWSGVIEPDFSVPSFITVPLMRSALRDQFLAMVREIEKRQAALDAPAAPASPAAPGGPAATSPPVTEREQAGKS